MNKTILSSVVLIILISSVTSVVLEQPQDENKKIVVAVSIGSLAPLVYSAGGNFVEVVSLVPAGTDPHEFIPTPSTISLATNSSLVVVTGHIGWESKLAEEVANNKKLSVEDVSINCFSDLKNNLTFLSLPSDLGGGINLHGFWLLPSNALVIVKAIANKLAVIDKAHASYYYYNYELFKSKLSAFKLFMSETLKDSNLYSKAVVAVTPDAQYLLAAFNFNVSQIMVNEGEEARPEVLSSIREGLKSGKFALIVATDLSTQSSSFKSAEEFSKEFNVPLISTYTLSSENLRDYFAFMSFNLGIITSSYSTYNSSTASKGLNTLDYSLIALSFVLLILVLVETFILVRRR
ncbi:MAG: metal ABC transporter substrate-binding protein [Thermoproteota archaeon]|nr:metal ABC transporter substrate-binding protein [Candidatus Brockarchaeota archaeon]MBO3768769.1 metal ABC transporter substrate-binding protein [Candidatus Brockarchaeota archaeon]MBO3800932.1 metal ABC transporter substrate-binding protein [Candidatus Brockarchaeota archaeon]